VVIRFLQLRRQWKTCGGGGPRGQGGDEEKVFFGFFSCGGQRKTGGGGGPRGQAGDEEEVVFSVSSAAGAAEDMWWEGAERSGWG